MKPFSSVECTEASDERSWSQNFAMLLVLVSFQQPLIPTALILPHVMLCPITILQKLLSCVSRIYKYIQRRLQVRVVCTTDFFSFYPALEILMKLVWHTMTPSKTGEKTSHAPHSLKLWYVVTSNHPIRPFCQHGKLLDREQGESDNKTCSKETSQLHKHLNTHCCLPWKKSKHQNKNEFAMSWIIFHENKKSATLTPLIMDRTTYIYPEYIHWIADRPWSYLHGFASGCHGVTGVIELRLVFEGGSHGHAVGVPAPVVKVLLAKAGFTDRITASQDSASRELDYWVGSPMTVHGCNLHGPFTRPVRASSTRLLLAQHSSALHQWHHGIVSFSEVE